MKKFLLFNIIIISNHIISSETKTNGKTHINLELLQTVLDNYRNATINKQAKILKTLITKSNNPSSTTPSTTKLENVESLKSYKSNVPAIPNYDHGPREDGDFVRVGSQIKN